MESNSEKSGNTSRKLSFTEVMDCLVEEGFRDGRNQGMSMSMPLSAGRLKRLAEISGAESLGQFLEFVFDHSESYQAFVYARLAMNRALRAVDDQELAADIAGRWELLSEEILLGI